MEKSDTQIPENPEKPTTSSKKPRTRDGGDPLPSRGDRPFTKLLSIAVVLSIALSAYSIYHTNAVFQGAFPGSQQLSVVATYSFGGAPGSQVLSAGSTGNFQLNVFYAGTTSTTLRLYFNATNANDWSGSCITTSCSGVLHRSLDMNVQSQLIVPINSDLATSQNYQPYATVNVSHGQNTYTGTISVDPSDTNLGSFVLQWFATS